MRNLLERAFGNTGNITQLLTNLQAETTANTNAINNLRTANESKVGKIVELSTFHGKEEEDPHEWLELFEQAHLTNNQPLGNNKARKIAIAAGYLRDAAHDWYQNDQGNITR